MEILLTILHAVYGRIYRMTLQDGIGFMTVLSAAFGKAGAEISVMKTFQDMRNHNDIMRTFKWKNCIVSSLIFHSR